MPRKTVTRWTFDEGRQELKSPAGLVVSVREISQILADRRDCRHDFAGEWAGWKMRRQFLIPPYCGRNGPKLTPENARRFVEWVQEPARHGETYGFTTNLQRSAARMDLAPKVTGEVLRTSPPTVVLRLKKKSAFVVGSMIEVNNPCSICDEGRGSSELCGSQNTRQRPRAGATTTRAQPAVGGAGASRRGIVNPEDLRGSGNSVDRPNLNRN